MAENKDISLADQIASVTGGSVVGNKQEIDLSKKELTSINDQISKIKKSDSKFDPNYYAKKYGDVAGDRYYGSRLEEHYNKHGNGEGRYKNQWEEDQKTGVNAKLLAPLELSKAKAENRLSFLSKIVKGNPPQEEINKAIEGLSAQKYDATSAFNAKLNYQVTDQDILNDYNNSKIAGYSNIINRGNTQITGIQERLNSANALLAQLPKNDPSRKTSEAYVKQLSDDLTSVKSAVANASTLKQNYKPITANSTQGPKEITSLRSYLQLPEERASQQLRQIDPESYQTSVALGQKYRQLATAPIGQTQSAQTEAFRTQLEKGYRDYSTSGIGATRDAQTEAYRAQLQKEIQGYSLGKIGATTSPQAEALRRQVEDETAAQLALGSRLGAEEQRQYQQYSRGAQAARGNIFGVAPAVEEAVTTGMAGEARKQARYGAASQFLSSGQTTSDALARDIQLREALQQGRYQAGGAMLASGQTVSDAMARDVQLRNALQQSKLGAGGQFLTSGQTMSDALRGDIAFRDALQQNRMGAAANFVAGGPSVYNLAQARTAGQQNAFQNYIQANQALPGGFNQQPSTAANFYQTTSPEIPVALTNAFNNLYSSLAGYQANTYGAQVGAISRQPSGASQFAQIAGGIGSLLSPLKFG